MKRGKVKLDKWFLSTLKHYFDVGWKLVGITHSDANGDFWFILDKE